MPSSDGNTTGFANSNGYRDADDHPDSYFHGHPDLDADDYKLSHSIHDFVGNIHTNRDSDAYRDCNAFEDSNSVANSISNVYEDADTDPNAVTDSNANADTNAHDY